MHTHTYVDCALKRFRTRETTFPGISRDGPGIYRIRAADGIHPCERLPAAWLFLVEIRVSSPDFPSSLFPHQIFPRKKWGTFDTCPKQYKFRKANAFLIFESRNTCMLHFPTRALRANLWFCGLRYRVRSRLSIYDLTSR